MSNLPWLLVGDFKVVRSFEESASDSDYSRAGMEAFDTCITNTELIDHHPMASLIMPLVWLRPGAADFQT
ncbi:hypothetical protein NC653_021849 [Populus alba x Populus x berolinensis]|uniref:Uncharacterized protein n=1 Tax=Populus alba x Populus x berolinensis TaxID=444605 RepID=A0AAD6MQT9_9ROSI|nr:hypothetical protein NC653_021849 [Populus alba x Populus x berolinensis]